MACTYLLTLQKFLSTFSFYASPKNDVLLNDAQYILKQARYISCPQKCNGYDCSLFAQGNLIHVVQGLPINDNIFTQDDITLFCQQLQNILSINVDQSQVLNPMTSLSREINISFSPILYTNYNLNDNKNIELDPFVAMMRNNNDVSPQKDALDDPIPRKKPLVVECQISYQKRGLYGTLYLENYVDASTKEMYRLSTYTYTSTTV
jgi:hypothetical protein